MEIRPIISAMLRSKTTPILVVFQVALSLALLVNAMHTVATRVATVSRESGVASESDVFEVSFAPVATLKHNEAIALQKEQELKLRGSSNIAAVTWTSQTPLSRSGSTSYITPEFNESKSNIEKGEHQAGYYVGNNFASTLGLTFLEGRDFTDAEIMEIDVQGKMEMPNKIVVTHALAKKLFPNDSQFVGKTLYTGGGPDASVLTITGVVTHLQTPSAQASSRGSYSTITPARGSTPQSLYLVRAKPGQRNNAMRDAESLLRQHYTGPALIKVRSMDEIRKNRYRNDTGLALMLAVVSAILVLVTASGVVGMTSMWVNQRHNVIGVRRALGATKADILRYFLTENALISGFGVVLGVVLAVLLNQFLSEKFSIVKLPYEYLGFSAALFFIVGVVAAFAPARRAATISPAVATRGA